MINKPISLILLFSVIVVIGCSKSKSDDADSGPDGGLSTETENPVPSDTGSPSTEAMPSDTGIPTEPPSATDTGMPSDTALPSDTGVPSDTASPSDTGTPEETETPTDTALPTEVASATATDTAVPTETETETETATDTGAEPDAGDDGGQDSDLDAGVPLTLVEVIPQAISREADETLYLVGTGFVDGMSVSIFNENVLTEPIYLGVATVEDNGDSASVLLPLDAERPQGLYDLTVTIPGGDSATLEGIIYISSLYAPKVTSVEPALAWYGDPDDDRISDRSVQISGEGFVNTPWVRWISVDDPDVSFQAREIHFIDSETVVAVVPSESESMPAGEYTVWVTNPDQLAAQWIDPDDEEPGVFEITETPAPMITGIDPVQSPFNLAVPAFTVSGLYFDAAAALALVGPDEDVPLSITSATDTEIVAAIPANTVELGLYPVRVTNPDGQMDVFYLFEAKNPTEGHFDGTFTSMDPVLKTPRERLALAYGFDAIGGTHLYASGGITQFYEGGGDDDPDGGVADAGVEIPVKEVLRDLETAPVDIHGQVGAWRVLQQWDSEAEPRVVNEHTVPRQGHAMVRVADTLFAIGGTSDDTSVELDDTLVALASVESAKILGQATMPTAQVPTHVGPGTLPEGTWYYRVSAIGPWGEGLASNEKQIINSGGTLELCWSAVENATAYNVYRSVAANGRPGTTKLLSTVTGSDATVCHQDDGANHPAPGFVSGEIQEGGALAEGLWVYRVTAVVNDSESVAGYKVSVATDADNPTVVLRWAEVPGATYNIYRSLAAVTELTGDEATYLLASGITATEWTDTGAAMPNEALQSKEGITPLPVGTLSRWHTLTESLTVPREGLAATLVATADKTYIYAVGGRSDAGGDGYLASIEKAEVLPSGDLGAWQLEAEEMTTSRAFASAVTNQPLGMNPLSPDPVVGDGSEPLIMFVVAGDNSFSSSGGNSGLQTIEAAEVDPVTGVLSAWVEQDSDLPMGRRTYANGAAVIDSFLYCFPGVDSEQAGLDNQGMDYQPSPLGSESTRFGMVIEAPLSDPYDDLLTGYMSSNGGLAVPRSYYGTVRVNAHIYIVGGNDEDGPIGEMESIRQ